MAPATILWRRLDKTGHDAARLTHKAPYWFLVGNRCLCARTTVVPLELSSGLRKELANVIG